MTRRPEEDDALAAFDRKMSRAITARRNLRSLRETSDDESSRKKDGKPGRREDSEEHSPPFKPFYNT